MFCVQESEDPLSDPYASAENDPFGGVIAALSESSDDEPPLKKPNMSYEPALNLTVYQIPVFSQQTYKENPYSKPTVLQKRYSAPEPIEQYSAIPASKPLYDLTPVRYKKNGEIAKKRGPPKGYKRKPKHNPIHMLSPSLTITPVNSSTPQHQFKLPTDTGLTITPSLPKVSTLPNLSNLTSLSNLPNLSNLPSLSNMPNLSNLPNSSTIPNLSNLTNMAAVTQALSNPNLSQLSLVQKNAILSGLLMSNAVKMTDGVNLNEFLKRMGMTQYSVPSSLSITPEMPRVKVPKGYEHVILELDPEDWFPDEPYRMSYSRKKNPKWKNFPHRCEHCFKGYRVASSLVSHAGERHGGVPRDLAIPCPCCQHVSVRRKQHRRHLARHAVRRGKLFCLYCIPPQDPSEPHKPEVERYPYDSHPQLYYASEESLRLHRKRKHPYAGMFNCNWFCTWGDGVPNS